jgi:hypothetical protein
VAQQSSQKQQAASEQAGDRAAHRADQEKAAQEAALKKANSQGQGATAGGEQSISNRGEQSQTGSTILTQGQTAKKTSKRKYGQSAGPAAAAPSATV